MLDGPPTPAFERAVSTANRQQALLTKPCPYTDTPPSSKEIRAVLNGRASVG